MPVPVPLAPPIVARPGFLRLRWASEIEVAYRIQAKNAFENRYWTNLEFVVTATATNMVIDVPLSGDSRFFRVVKAD
jgi:hypothetical protein